MYGTTDISSQHILITGDKKAIKTSIHFMLIQSLFPSKNLSLSLQLKTAKKKVSMLGSPNECRLVNVIMVQKCTGPL